MGDWRHHCQGLADIEIIGDIATVRFKNGRRHDIRVGEIEDAIVLTGIVVRSSLVQSIPEVDKRAWLRNRASQLVGFRIDQRGRLIGEAWLPKAGMERDEFVLHLRRLAAECDWFELMLTGDDRE